METKANNWLVKDDFLSDIFGIPWMRVEAQLSAEDYEKVSKLLFDLPAGTKIDLPLDAQNIRLAAILQHDGWYLGSTKMLFVHDPNPVIGTKKLPKGIVVEPLSNEQYAATLIERASDVFVHDRYHNDPNLDHAKVVRLYRQWMSNNIKFRCEEILTATSETEVLGFLCVIKEPDSVYFELIGVFEQHQYKGIGTGLVSAAVQRYLDQPIRVVTQFHNISMQRVLINCGFKPIRTLYIFTRHV